MLPVHAAPTRVHVAWPRFALQRRGPLLDAGRARLRLRTLDDGCGARGHARPWGCAHGCARTGHSRVACEQPLPLGQGQVRTGHSCVARERTHWRLAAEPSSLPPSCRLATFCTALVVHLAMLHGTGCASGNATRPWSCAWQCCTALVPLNAVLLLFSGPGYAASALLVSAAAPKCSWSQPCNMQAVAAPPATCQHSNVGELGAQAPTWVSSPHLPFLCPVLMLGAQAHCARASCSFPATLPHA